MHTFTIRLPEAGLHRRALLRVLQDIDLHLPLNTADATVTVRLNNDDGFWAMYRAVGAVRDTCDAAPLELAGLSTAVQAVLDDMEAILGTEREE